MHSNKQAFTLIELSIVLVIIGLIVGGVLVGRDLIVASAIRAQISQIEKYQTAVNTFKGQFNALPGDITGSQAAQFGFTPRVGGQGRGDGNGVIEGFNYQTSLSSRANQTGETALFWSDLGTVKLINGSFTTASDSSPTVSDPLFFLPSAAIGQRNFVYVTSGNDLGQNGSNYFGLFAPDSSGISNRGNVSANLGLTVKQAYMLDVKMDDGIPYAGNIQAFYYTHPGIQVAPYAFAPSTTTCYDQCSGACIATGQYSVTQNNGNGVNCAISFKFQ